MTLVYTLLPETDTYMVGTFSGVNGNGCQGTCQKQIQIQEEWNKKKVTVIAKKAFCQCGITKVTIPASIISIQANSFDINSIAQITLPSNLKELCDYCFATNTFSTVKIPRTVISIGLDPFGHNPNLQSIIVEEGNEHFCTDLYGSLMTKNQTIFIFGLPNLDVISIPPTVHTIQTQSLDALSKYKQIIIQGDIKNFMRSSMNNLQQLKEIYYFGKTPIPSGILLNCPTPKIYVCNDYTPNYVDSIPVTHQGYCSRQKVRCFTASNNIRIYGKLFLFHLFSL